jgi:L-alanine-DL-glutamate epimerase-like enolase superfamily enzyme
MSLLARTLVPRLIGREAEEIEAIWRDLLFATHATSVGAITSLALAAVDTALRDLRFGRRFSPLRGFSFSASAHLTIPYFASQR